MFPRPAEILKQREGTVAEVPLPLLLNALSAEERTCTLELKVRAMQKRIDFEDGAPVGCSSNLLHETLGRYLVEKGKLAEDQYQAALLESVNSGARMGELLVQKGLITPYELYRQLQANLAHKILDAFRWVEAKYRIVSGEALSDSPVRMNTAQLIVTGSATLLPFDVVTTALLFDDAQRFALVPSPRVALEHLKLSSKEARIVAALKARPTFGELTQRSGVELEETLRRLFAYCVIGAVDFADAVPAASGAAAGAGEGAGTGAGAGGGASAEAGRGAAGSATTISATTASAPHPGRGGMAGAAASAGVAPAAGAAAGSAQHPAPAIVPESARGGLSGASPPAGPTPSGAAPQPAAPAPAPGLPFGDDDEALKNALVAAFMEIRSKDAFDLLGATLDSGQNAIRDAFLSRSDRFSPVRFRATELREKAQALLLAYAKAYGALADPDTYQVHRTRRLNAESARKAAAQKNTAAEQFRIRTDLLDATSQYRDGRARMEAGNYRGAVELLEYACEIDPRPEYRAHLARARYLLNPDAHAKLALQELTEVVKAAPTCEPALLFAADIHRARGDFSAAEQCYRDAFRANPRERKYADLANEMTRMKKR